MNPLAHAASEAVNAAVAVGKIPAARAFQFWGAYVTDPVGTQGLLDALAEPTPAVLQAMTGKAPDEALYDALWPRRSPAAPPSVEPEYIALYGAP